MAGSAIEVIDVSKRFVLGDRLGGYTTLRESFGRRQSAEDAADTLWALRNVSFEVARGETLGVIGHNGAGKTTLLRVLARITEPTEGVSRTRGRAGALLDVGTGFHPELTGRENIFLNAAILGMSRRDARLRFDEIVDFSGLERFLDTPLKRFSWGMYLRLAFAVAAHVDPAILIVDEVLAVGDARFRDKCLGKIAELGREGRTVVFVSHDLGSVTQVCRRALWLEHGQVVDDGPTESIVQRYVRGALGTPARAAFEADESRAVQVLAAGLFDGTGAPVETPERGQALTLGVTVAVRESLPNLDVALNVRDRRGIAILDEIWGVSDGRSLPLGAEPATLEIRLALPAILAAGDYVLGVWLGSSYDTVLEEEVLRFRVWPRADDPSDLVERDRAVHPNVDWTVTRLS